MIGDLVIDVGMHRGEDTAFYLKKGFRVVGVEANPALCDRVADQMKDAVADGRLTIINAAVTEAAGPVPFYINERLTDWSTTQKSWVERNARMGGKSREITVEGIRFADILAEHGVPYYLKIDIEGNDMLCLEALREVGSRPKHVSIESVKTSLAELRREFDLFRDLGYTRFKVVNQVHVPAQTCPDPPREGVYAAHSFPVGASGLFGEEAPGRWLSRNEALLLYRWIFAKYAAVGNYGVFPNLHWRIRKPLWLKHLVRPGWYDTHATRA